jgi:hypothetical protein
MDNNRGPSRALARMEGRVAQRESTPGRSEPTDAFYEDAKTHRVGKNREGLSFFRGISNEPISLDAQRWPRTPNTTLSGVVKQTCP